MSSTRRDAREWALQMLFRLEMNPCDNNKLFAEFFEEIEADKKARDFAEKLIKGVREHRDEIDGLIKKYAQNWDLDRMAIIDRNAIRIALYEMLYCDDIPPAVSINEAIDIAKYFNKAESGKFVNGILDRVRKELSKQHGAG